MHISSNGTIEIDVPNLKIKSCPEKNQFILLFRVCRGVGFKLAIMGRIVTLEYKTWRVDKAVKCGSLELGASRN